jgi:hypothetical protein
MPFSVLSHLLHVERHRQRITRSAMAAGFATPALGEIQLRDSDGGEPLLATNMRGTFLRTRKSRDHVIRYGFSPCPVEAEGVLVSELARVLWDLSEAHHWDLRCRAVPEAVETFRARGMEPRTVVVSSQFARTVLGQETPPPEGLAGVVDKMQVLVTLLPEDVALVALAPISAGTCVRVGDNIGMLIRPSAFRVVHT